MDFLEELKTRLQEATRKLADAQKEMLAAQGRFQAVAQEHGSLQHLINVEQAARQKANEQQDNFFPEIQRQEPPQSTVTLSTENQTDTVRNLLKQHPTGITPRDMWKQVQTQIKYRAYFYSILKRLRDKDEVIVRRGKYMMKIVPKVEEGKEHTSVH